MTDDLDGFPVLVVAAVVALALSFRTKAYRPVAAALVSAAVVDLARDAVWGWLAPFVGEAPLTGWPRVVAHADQMLFISWQASLAALTRWTFGRRSPWPVLLGWMAVGAVLAAAYPWLRAERLATAYLGCELLALGVSVQAVIGWLPGREHFDGARLATLALLATEAVIPIGPYLSDPFTNWGTARVAYAVGVGILAIAQGVIAWRSYRPS